MRVKKKHTHTSRKREENKNLFKYAITIVPNLLHIQHITKWKEAIYIVTIIFIITIIICY